MIRGVFHMLILCVKPLKSYSTSQFNYKGEILFSFFPETSPGPGVYFPFQRTSIQTTFQGHDNPM